MVHEKSKMFFAFAKLPLDVFPVVNIAAKDQDPVLSSDLGMQKVVFKPDQPSLPVLGKPFKALRAFHVGFSDPFYSLCMLV